MTALFPCSVEYLACTNMRLSASSWEQLSSPWRPISWVLRTARPFVTVNKFGADIWQSSLWVIETTPSCCHHAWRSSAKLMELCSSLWPCVFLLHHVWTCCRLWGWTGCTHQTLGVSCHTCCCMSVLLAGSPELHSSRMSSLLGDKACTKAEPSTMRTSALGSWSVGTTWVSRIDISWDFWQLYSLPPSLNAAENAWSRVGKTPSDRTLCSGWRWTALRIAGNPPLEASVLTVQQEQNLYWKSQLGSSWLAHRQKLGYSPKSANILEFYLAPLMCDRRSAAELGWAISFVSSEYKSWLSFFPGRDCQGLTEIVTTYSLSPGKSSVLVVSVHLFHTETQTTLRWRHNGRHSVSDHQPHDCLLNRLFRRRSKKASKLRVTGLCAGNSPGTGEFPAQMASNARKMFPFDDVIMDTNDLPLDQLPSIYGVLMRHR